MGCVVQGLMCLHEGKRVILHCDLKSPNILVDKYWRCKLADFNLSRIKSHLEPNASMPFAAAAENPRWLAPEVRSLTRSLLVQAPIGREVTHGPERSMYRPAVAASFFP